MRFLGRDHLAQQQHLHRRLARHGAGQRHPRRRAEQPDIHARACRISPTWRRPPGRSSRPAGSRRRWRCPAPRRPPAAAGSPPTASPPSTPPCVASKNPAPPSASARCAVISFRSWPAEKAGPSAAMHHAADGVSAATVSSAACSVGHHGAREAVARRRPVEGEDRDRALVPAQHRGRVVAGCGHGSLPCEPGSIGPRLTPRQGRGSLPA